MIEEKVKFEGQKIELQNMTLVIPPLNFAILRKQEGLKKLKTVMNGFKNAQKDGDFELAEETLLEAAELIWMAAKRNYPDLTLEQIEEGLDFSNAVKIIPALMIQNPTTELRAFVEKNG
jgi:hypothetical protein